MNRLRWVISLTTLLFALGLSCSSSDSHRPKTYHVSGQITQGGQPLAGANVTFHGTDGSQSAVGVTDDQGQYTLTTFTTGDGAVAGEYQVTVNKFDRPVVASTNDGSIADTGDEPEASELPMGDDVESPSPKSLLSQKYADPKTSGLTATVTEDGENKFDFIVD